MPSIRPSHAARTVPGPASRSCAAQSAPPNSPPTGRPIAHAGVDPVFWPSGGGTADTVYVFFAGYVADLSEAQDVWMIAIKGQGRCQVSGILLPSTLALSQLVGEGQTATSCSSGTFAER